MIRHIVLPGALPSALTGLQLSVISSMLALVVGEQINATSGLGFMITQAQQFLNNSVIMVALIVYSILGLLLTLGMFASLVAALVVLPVLLRVFGGKPDVSRRELRDARTAAPSPAS